MVKFISICLFTCAVLLSGMGTLKAAEIPFNALAKDYDSCLVAARSLKRWAAGYCLCTALNLHNRLDLEDYLTLTAKTQKPTAETAKSNLNKTRAVKQVREIGAECKLKISQEMKF